MQILRKSHASVERLDDGSHWLPPLPWGGGAVARRWTLKETMSRKKARLGRIFCCVGLATLFPSGCHRSKDPSGLASAVGVASDSGPGGDAGPPPGAKAQDEKEGSGGLALL